MDDVMRQSWVRRLFGKECLQNRSGLETPGIRFVCGIFGGGERQSVEDLRLVVVGIFCGNLLHGVAIGEQTGGLRSALEGVVQLADCGDVGPFAIGLCTSGFAAFGVLLTCLQLAFVFSSQREGITPIAKGDSPVGDRASRVTSQRLVETLYCAAELERMKQGHCAIKFLLSWLVAGSGKVYDAQFLWIR